MGVAGYLAYQTDTLGNVLNNMNAHHWSGVVSRAILSTTMFFAYPMNLYIVRHVCVVLFFEGTLAHEGDDSTVLMRRDRRVTLTWVLYISSLIPAILMDSTGKVLSVTGAIGGSCIAYIGPGLAFLAVHSNEFIQLVHKRWGSSSRKLWGYPMEVEAEMEAASGVDNARHLEVSDGATEHQAHNLIAKGSNVDVVIWYIIGMPIWSAIAKIGQSKLAEYFEKEKLASPSVVKPKRVTIVDSTRYWQRLRGYVRASAALTAALRDVTSNGEGAALIRPSTLGAQYGSNVTEGYSNVGGTNSVELTPEEVEIELKNEKPTWGDFLIAMAYVILGVVALVFGLVSVLFM